VPRGVRWFVTATYTSPLQKHRTHRYAAALARNAAKKDGYDVR